MAWIVDINKALKIINETKFPYGPLNWEKILDLIKHCVKRTASGPKVGKDKQIEMLEIDKEKLKRKLARLKQELSGE